MAAPKQKEINTGYVPRSHQKDLHASLRRFNVLVCHRRFGKTVFAVNEMIDKGLRLYIDRGRTDRPRPRFSYIAPTYGQAKKISWDYFKAYTAKLPGVSVNEAELRIDISLFGDDTNTLRFQLLGAENPASLKGVYNDGIILDEYAEMSPKVWTEALRPTLLDRKGWGIFIGTPKGRNHFYDLHVLAQSDADWFTRIYKASESGVLDEEELKTVRPPRTPPDEYKQEYECSFEGSTIGSYYGDLMSQAHGENRITNVPYDPAVPVFTAWDLGIGDQTVVWFYQKVFKEIHIIDYMEFTGRGVKDIIRDLRAKPYVYHTHFWPHDGAARELITGKTRQQTAEKLGLKPIYIAKKDAIDDGIDATRLMLPRCWFDKDNCHRGIICLEQYKKQFDDKKQVFLRQPQHDQYSHGADGFRTLAMTLDSEGVGLENLPDEAETDFNPFGRKSRRELWAE